MNTNELIRMLLKKQSNKVTKTKKLNKNKRWVFENNRGYLFVYNSSNKKVPIRSKNVAYRNNGKRIVSIGNYSPVSYSSSGGYRSTRTRRRRRY